MSDIEFESDDHLLEDDRHEKHQDYKSFCPRCGYPMLPEDQGTCPRCGFKVSTGRNHPISDKRFPKWSRDIVETPLHSMNLKLWQEIALSLVSIFLLSGLGYLLSYIFEVSISPEELYNNAAFYNALLNLIVYVIVLIITLCLIIPNFKAYIKSFFGKGIAKRTFLTGLAFFGLLLGYSFLWGMITELIYYGIGIEQSSNANQSGIVDMLSSQWWWIIGIATCFIAPITEELAYRAGLFASLKRFNRVAAFIICGLIFGLIHFDFTVFWNLGDGALPLVYELLNLPSYIGAGIILCFAYEEWGIGASTMAHMFNNVASFIATMIVTRIPIAEMVIH